MHIDFEMKLEIFYRNILKTGDLVIDVGAHSGRHSDVFASLVGLQGSVISFEPNPNIIKLLKKRSKYWIDNKVVKIKQFATSDENIKTTFIIADDRPEESGLIERKYNGPTTTSQIDVTVIKLDSIINEVSNLKFIKIDTEGAEYKTLLGGLKLIENFKPIIAFEFGKSSYSAYGVNPNEMYSFFEDLNYKIYSINGSLLSRDSFIYESKVQNFWDYIACHNNDIKIVEEVFMKVSEIDLNDLTNKLKVLYNKILNRHADVDGLNYYIQKIVDRSLTLSLIEAIMKESEEYKGFRVSSSERS